MSASIPPASLPQLARACCAHDGTRAPSAADRMLEDLLLDAFDDRPRLWAPVASAWLALPIEKLLGKEEGPSPLCRPPELRRDRTRTGLVTVEGMDGAFGAAVGFGAVSELKRRQPPILTGEWVVELALGA
mmetsp:Transcript_1363/g.3944  ORF Transcript_1363/g.3944 Transcript_1363/m.3944 type:complete len:131 (-) Transcript_1363:1520-1912(-)